MKKEIRSFVEQQLEIHPKLRDSNHLLYSQYLKIIKGYDTEAMSVRELLIAIEKGECATIDTVSRSSRKVQQDNPRLRGLKYDKRKEKEEEYRIHFG